VFNEELGAPRIALRGRALEISRQKGIQRMLVSISHDRNYAVAQVVAEGPGGGD
jgi:holo-[acyl-carrier protein] synthase